MDRVRRGLKDLHPYQDRAITALYEADRTLLISRMGAGKTIITLTVITEWLRDGVVDQVWIICPKRVAGQVWPYEIEGWTHLDGFTVQHVSGTPEERLALLRQPAKIRVINFDLLPWLKTVLKRFPDRSALVIDETSRVKNPRGTWAKTLAKMLDRSKVDHRIGLTGTPMPHHRFDLFAQVKLIYGPKVWGSSFDKWRSENFYKPDLYKEQWLPLPGHDEVLDETFSDLALRVTPPKGSAADIPFTPIYDRIDLPLAVRSAHDRAIRKWLLDLPDRSDPELLRTAAVGSIKARQILAGFVLDEDGQPHSIHDVKLNATAEIVEDSGEPCIICYQFAAERDALLRRHPSFGLLGGGVSDRDAARYERLWNDGNLDGIVLHPACLHPDTEVLTEKRGWVRIVEVRDDERVHDGVEWVRHDGCGFSGVRSVINCFGILMTPEHKILIGDRWVRAKDVRDTEDTRRAALYRQGGAHETGAGKMPDLRGGGHNAVAKRNQGQPEIKRPLSTLYRRYISPPDQDVDLANLARYQVPCDGVETTQGTAVSRTWYGPKVGRFQQLPTRHGADISRWHEYRPYRQLKRLLASKLPLGAFVRTARPQSQFAPSHIQRSGNAPCRILPCGRSLAGGDHSLFEPWTNPRPSTGGISGVVIPQRAEVSPVFDLVNCGPRNRFLIRNHSGEVFVSHNSAGHGLNLQYGGSRLIWNSRPWSTEEYQQTIARLARQGQTEEVFVHHIVADRTLDDVQTARLTERADAQDLLVSYVRTIEKEDMDAL